MARKDFEGQESSGGFTDFEFEVTDAYFAESEAYNQKIGGSGGLMLHLLGRTNLPEAPIFEIDGFHPSYTLSADWQTLDGGKTITHPKGEKAKLGKNYGRFCQRVVEITEDIADTPQDPLAQADPRSAAIWLGTKWFLEDEEFGSGQYKTRKLMPTKYLGKVAGVVAGASSAGVATTPTSPSGLREQVTQLASVSATFPEFQAKLLSIPGITEDVSLLEEALNPAGIFATVKS